MAVIRRSNSSLKVLANTRVSSDYNWSPQPRNLNTEEISLPSTDTAIVDSGASGIYLIPTAPCTDINTTAPPVKVGTASGTLYISSASCNLNLHILPARGGHIILGFQHNLLGIDPLCYRGCKVIHDKHAVHVLDETSKVISQGWREPTGARLWRLYLRSGRHHQSPNNSPPAPNPPPHILEAHNDSNMPSVKALARYLHVAAGYLSSKRD